MGKAFSAAGEEDGAALMTISSLETTIFAEEVAGADPLLAEVSGEEGEVLLPFREILQTLAAPR